MISTNKKFYILLFAITIVITIAFITKFNSCFLDKKETNNEMINFKKIEEDPLIKAKKKMISEKLIEYNKLSVSDVSVVIVKEDENYISGQMPLGSGGPYNGGRFLMMKKNSEWEVVYGGEDDIPCDKLIDLKFPKTMINECY